ncbi:lysophospholipid acyltransferase family protein [Acinetobacter tianfuensis]|uniref:Lipid A biosynthesis acyltransferase n=1 Tax=Acinetobacter tianfuensis TaxID=2419603 RepID=A0A3A8EUT6_9GAMM|nr:lysophospholipid acyltransferase family protein [Acinetobacter tianfuensis]RKG32631.1 lipid A biosynthesis acyltransferase [Acinetobacter tianfuensis]
MTQQSQQNAAANLLKFISRQPIQLSRFIARGLAALVNLFKISKTASTFSLNMQIALPELSDQERKRIMAQAVRNELMAYFEFFCIWGSNNEKNLSRIHQVYGEQYFHDAMAAQKGLVLIVPHFGTWEIMNCWFAKYTQMTIMYKPVKDPAADEFVRQARSREQANLVPTDESGVRQIFKALKQGGTTVILPDHTPNTGGEMIEYFGIPLATSNLSAKLIQKTKSAALFVYAMRNENNGFDMYIEPVNARIYEGTANDGSRVIFEKLEDLIHKYPEHYHWSYKRFKANPALEDIYNRPVDEAIHMIQTVRKTAQQSESAT